ncbi:MobA/MobL family protein [Ramlibacter sp. G-1-2-2]|uniref:MobA/MobL family protein n=1 Tax=Ramlibacter agri TaxID=2728837 RepID=A0A848HB69_9BURK|nr:MobA/MobL family protein [Ramlibacter agri]NML48025.1 MobA/MobL family protein [Ramlibacter agri]
MFHLHVRYRSRDSGGSCDSARQYIAREGRFAGRGDKVRWVQSFHMPEWVRGDSAPTYWRAAEGPNSRVNARTAILLEFAVPKPLAREDQDALVREMAEHLSKMGIESEDAGVRLPVTMAFHEGYGRNPHAHGLVSLSLNDGIARNEQTWFRRYSAENPEKGGARRSEYVTKRRWLYRVRELWARLANAALIRRGMEPALDHRSHADRGLRTEPQIHLGPRIAEMSRKGVITTRGSRSRAIEGANALALTVEAQLLRRRQEVRQAELEAQASLDAERRWRSMQQVEWIELLRNHPLTRAPGELKGHASAVVVESDRSNAGTVGQALNTYSDVKLFAAALGPDWDAVATPDGFWAFRPGQESVVLLGRGYVATDGQDEGSLRALLNSVPMLRMKQPLVAIKENLRDAAEGLLRALGLGWRIAPIDSPAHRKKTRPSV